jgi:hypothetical protein
MAFIVSVKLAETLKSPTLILLKACGQGKGLQSKLAFNFILMKGVFFIMADLEVIFCSKCKKTKSAINFYQSHNLEKYPTGKLNMCKECLTMHVDNWDPETYLWILQECDVPYIPEEWNKILMNYG